MWAIIQFYYCVANLNKEIRFNSVLLEWDYFVTDKGKNDQSYPSQQIMANKQNFATDLTRNI